jgi:hypothetical protein
MSESIVTKLDNGIVSVLFPKKGHITLDMLHRAYAQIRLLAIEPVQVMIVGQRVHYVEYDALQLTTSPEINLLVAAQAIVTKTRLECLLGKLYLKTHRPKYPSRCFLTEDEAQYWLLNAI